MRLSIGVIIGICLIVYWWMHDHPSAQPVKQGFLIETLDRAA